MPPVASLLVGPPPRPVSQPQVTGGNVPSPPPSPAHPALVMGPLNNNDPSQFRAVTISSQVSNLRVRLDRVQHRLSNLRNRRSMAVAEVVNMYSAVVASTSSGSNQTPEDVGTSTLSESYFPNDEPYSTQTLGPKLTPSHVMPFGLLRLQIRDSYLGPISLGMNYFANLHSNFASFPTFYSQRRMLAVYTHEYDPSGTRLFTAGGPIASHFHGNVAALWE
ncbi:unnamed protein product [Heterobilharzia americana]|nr:unnamed protein product [Heterobilharzia americana]